MTTPIFLNSDTSFLAVNVTQGEKELTLPYISSFESEGRLLHIYPFMPDIYDYTVVVSNVIVNAPPGGSFFGGKTQFILSTNNSIATTLQSVTSNQFAILNYTISETGISAEPPGPSTVPVYPSTNSIVFVDLTSESKVVVLPSVESLITSSSECPYLLIKDVNGMADNNPLFISSSSETALVFGAVSTLCLSTKYTAIELVGASFPGGGWFPINYYAGN